jgi:hypothetical protein
MHHCHPVRHPSNRRSHHRPTCLPRRVQVIVARPRPWSRYSRWAYRSTRLEREPITRASHRRTHRHLPLRCARAVRRVRL